MYRKLMFAEWWQVLILLICAITHVSSDFVPNAKYSHLGLRDLILDITVAEGKGWATGFLVPPSAMEGVPPPVKTSPVFIYNFKANDYITYSKKRFQLSLVFHEYYFRCRILVCNYIPNLLTPLSVLAGGMDLDKHKANLEPFRGHCNSIDPEMNGLVYNTSGPAFVETICYNPLGRIPERHAVRTERGGLFYNFTYELNVVEENSTVERHVNDQKLAHMHLKGPPCHNNGYYILHPTESEDKFEFSCKCLFGTNGSSCRYGPHCPPWEDRSLCNNHGVCWSIPLEKRSGCLCDEDYVGPSCNHFTAFDNPGGNHNLNECKSNETCHFCYKFPDGREKCSCRMSYKLSSSGLCVDDSLVAILKYESEQSITKSDLATEIKNMFPSIFESRSQLVNQLSIDESLKIIKVLQIPKSTLKKISNSSLWQKQLESFSVMTNSSSKNLSNCSDNADIASNGIKFTLVRIQYARTVIEMFRGDTYSNSTLRKICCFTFTNHFSITFAKEGNVINEEPFNLSAIKDITWRRGDLELESHENGVCLKFNKASEIDDGLYTCKVEDPFHVEEKELYIQQNKPRFAVEVEPERVTVLKGGNVTIICKVKNKTYWGFHPWLSFYTSLSNSSASVNPVQTRTISVTLDNVMTDLIVTCNASDEYSAEKYYAETPIPVFVINPYLNHCAYNFSCGIHWQPQTVSGTSRMRCPSGYTGYCTRDCVLGKDLNSSVWQLPDCSQCERKDISLVVKNISLYSRGIKSFLPYPNLVFRTIKDILSKAVGDFLPGEMSSVIRTLNYCLTALNLDFAFDDIYSLLNLIMSKDNFILEKDYENLEALVNRLPMNFPHGQYETKYINKDSLTGYLSVPFYYEFPYRVIFPEEDVHDRKRSVRKLRTYSQTSVLIYEERKRARLLSITVFKKSQHFFKHQKKIIHKVETEDDDMLKDYIFGRAVSPLIQARLYGEHDILSDESAKITVTFDQCIHQMHAGIFSSIPSSNLRCGRYIPKRRIWNTTSCTLNVTEEFCSCTCFGLDGWLGFVDSNSSEYTKILLTQNIMTAVGCILSSFALTLTVIILLVRCGFWSTRLLTKVMECFSLLVTNVVFFCSVVNRGNGNQMALLIIISGSLVLALSMSICHQIDILSKYQECQDGPRRGTDVKNPSLLLAFACTLFAILLGAILWTIGVVKSIVPSNAWLPENDEASCLSLVIFCSLSLILLLICIMASISWLKLNSLTIICSSTRAKMLFRELKKTSFLTLMKIIFISASIYQDRNVGKYIFFISSVLLGVSYLVLYTCETLRSSNPSESTLHSPLPGNKTSKRKLCDLKECLFRWLCSTAEMYSRVAGTEVSSFPNDNSTEIRRRDDSLSPPNTSVKDEENDNRFSALVNTESQLANNGNKMNSDESIPNEDRICTSSDKISSLNNARDVIVSIERFGVNGRPPNACSLTIPVKSMKTQTQNGKLHGNQQTVTERYLCMNGNGAIVELQSLGYVNMNGNHGHTPIKSHSKETGVQVLYQNVSDKTEGDDIKISIQDSKLDVERNKLLDRFSSGGITFGKTNYDMCNLHTCTLPHNKNLFSKFSSKFSLLGSKTKVTSKNLSSGWITTSPDRSERSILINGGPTLLYKDSDIQARNTNEYCWGHKRQHSL